MSERPTDLTESPPPATEEDDGASPPTEVVRELFLTLAKALRAYQLYDPNNPVYQRFVSALAEAFVAVWDELDLLHVAVSEERIVFEGEEVYRGDSRGESLAFLLYKDGIRDVTFLPGIEGSELTRFLSVLHRARTLRPEDDDLLTILWEEDLAHFRYNYVDVLAEGVVLPEPGPGNTQAELEHVLEEEVEGDLAAVREGEDLDRTVQREDFNPTLYSLDGRELDRLREEVRREMERDLRHDVLTALFDRIEEPDRRDRQSEILGIFHQLLPNFLSRGALSPARDVLALLRRLAASEGVFDEVRRKEVSELITTLSSPETMRELVRALEDGTIRPSADALSSFLQHLHGTALPPLVRAAETTEVKELRPVLRDAVRGIAERNPAVLARLLDQDDPILLAGAVRLVGTIGVEEAAPVVADLLFHDQTGVRLAAIDAARSLAASTPAEALVDALWDPVRDVRVEAARALGHLRYAPSAEEFSDIVGSKDIRDADLGEKIAFFESYALVAGADAIPLLDDLLNGRSLLGRREPEEVRACAALALGRIDSPAARSALEAALPQEEPVVRSAVNRALRGEEE